MTRTTQEINFRSLLNFRDLGGVYAMENKRLKHGLIFRSANPDKLSRKDIGKLSELNIKTIIDLRAPGEIGKRRINFDHAENISLPLDFQQETRDRLRPVIYKKHSEDLIAEISNTLYLDILDASGHVFGKIMEMLGSPVHTPLLVHCQAGKDRTGIISALVMLAMGVPREFIISDFMKSNDALSAYFKRRFLLRSMLTFGYFPYHNLLYAVTVKKRNIESVLDRIEDHYGGIGAYLSVSGFDISQLPALRKKLLEDRTGLDIAENVTHKL